MKGYNKIDSQVRTLTVGGIENGEVRVAPGATVTLPLIVDEGNNIIGINLTVYAPSDMLADGRVTLGPTVTNYQLSQHGKPDGALDVAIYGPNALPAGTVWVGNYSAVVSKDMEPGDIIDLPIVCRANEQHTIVNVPRVRLRVIG